MEELGPGRYTLVRHSAWDTKHSDFARAVETCFVCNRDIAKVARAGGIILNTYEEACEREYTENYPDTGLGAHYPIGSTMIPQATGSFSKTKIDGREIYVLEITSNRKRNEQP